MIRYVIAIALVLSLPSIVLADYWVKSCGPGGCTVHRVRTPVRNTVSTWQPVRGLFGRIRGYQSVTVPVSSGYGSSGQYSSGYSSGYGSSGQYSSPVQSSSSGQYQSVPVETPVPVETKSEIETYESADFIPQLSKEIMLARK